MHGTPYFIFNYYSNKTMKVGRELISNFCNDLLIHNSGTTAVFIRLIRSIDRNVEFDIEWYGNNERHNYKGIAFDESNIKIVYFSHPINDDSNFTKINWGEPIITDDLIV